jgi:hypothetical protein
MGFMAAALVLADWSAGGGQPPKDKVDVKVVKYDELGDLVASHKGKVVLVELWNTG